MTRRVPNLVCVNSLVQILRDFEIFPHVKRWVMFHVVRSTWICLPTCTLWYHNANFKNIMYFGTFIRHDWVYRQSDDMAQYTEKQSLYIEVHDSDPLLVHTAGIKFIFSQKFILQKNGGGSLALIRRLVGQQRWSDLVCMAYMSVICIILGPQPKVYILYQQYQIWKGSSP